MAIYPFPQLRVLEEDHHRDEAALLGLGHDLGGQQILHGLTVKELGLELASQVIHKVAGPLEIEIERHQEVCHICIQIGLPQGEVQHVSHAARLHHDVLVDVMIEVLADLGILVKGRKRGRNGISIL